MNNLINNHFFTFLVLTFLLGVCACGSSEKNPENISAQPKVEKLEALEQTKNEYKDRAMTDSSIVLIDTTTVAKPSTLESKSLAKVRDQKSTKSTDNVKKKKVKVSKPQNPVVKRPIAPPPPKKKDIAKVVKEEEAIAELAFKRNFFNYDTITKGDKVEHQFEFTNIGETPVVIKSATATCGCTEPSYPFMPIAPGEKGYIGVKYDSSTKEGKQNAIITVIANTDPSVFKLYLDGVVNVPSATKGDKEPDNK